jgi:hypothetical protein
MKLAWLVFAVLVGMGASLADAQVSSTGQQSTDKSAKTRQIAISTMDRSSVPLMIESRQTKVDPHTTRTESVAKGRLNDGSYFDWRDMVTTERALDPHHTEIVQDLQENDRQGGTRTVQQIKQEIETTATGEASTETSYRRNSSGTMTLDQVRSITTRDGGNGATITSTTKQTADVNGNLHPVEQVQETAVQISPTEVRTASQVSRPDHLDGQFKVVEQDVTTVQKSGDTTRTEKTIQSRTAEGWTDTGKVVTTETRAADGSVARETVQEGMGLYADRTTSAINDVPQSARKIVEHEVQQPDGRFVEQRDVFTRDVNGDWKPQTFSTVVPSVSP